MTLSGRVTEDKVLLSGPTHRLDVELAARMFRHLSSLPVSFFASRQTGRTTARAAEPQTIRTFLTGQAPTALIDLVFTFVFFGVIFFFAPILALVVAVAMAGIFVVYGVITPNLRKRLMVTVDVKASDRRIMEYIPQPVPRYAAEGLRGR